MKKASSVNKLIQLRLENANNGFRIPKCLNNKSTKKGIIERNIYENLLTPIVKTNLVKVKKKCCQSYLKGKQCKKCPNKLMYKNFTKTEKMICL